MSHALVHMLSNKPLTYADVERIMLPYWEGNVFPEYEEDENGEELVQTIIYPQFRWDYYTIQAEVRHKAVADCYVLIDPEGWCIARKWWNGQKWIDQTFDFENYIAEHRHEWEGKVYIIEIDIHW